MIGLRTTLFDGRPGCRCARPVTAAPQRRQDAFEARAPGTLADPHDSRLGVVRDHRGRTSVRQPIISGITPAFRDVSKDRQITRFVRRLVLAAFSGAESSVHLPQVVATAKDQGRRRPMRVADPIHDRPLPALTVDGIDDDDRRVRDERLVEPGCHLAVGLVPHAIVCRDVHREAARLTDPRGERDPEVLVHVTASNEHPAEPGVEMARRGRLA